jgi:hypothetical protein
MCPKLESGKCPAHIDMEAYLHGWLAKPPSLLPYRSSNNNLHVSQKYRKTSSKWIPTLYINNRAKSESLRRSLLLLIRHLLPILLLARLQPSPKCQSAQIQCNSSSTRKSLPLLVPPGLDGVFEAKVQILVIKRFRHV